MINKIKSLRKLPRHGMPGGWQATRRRMERGGPEIGPISGPAPDVPTTTTTGQVYTDQQIQALQQQAVANYLTQQSLIAQSNQNGQTFQILNLADDILNDTKEVVTAGLWSDNLTELTSLYTGSLTTTQKRYYVNVYQKDYLETGSAVQFALAYGNSNGSGSSALGTLDDAASRAIYSQYKQLLLDKNTSKFSTVTSGSTDSIYVVNFQRNRTKEKLDPANWELPLTGIISRDTNATGSVTVGAVSGSITLIDDSSLTDGSIEEAGRVYNVVSGSINAGVYNSAAPHYYGTVYPAHSAIVLDGDILDARLNFTTNTGSNSEGDNHFALYHSISGSYSASSAGFQARNKETITSTIYFIRIKNGDFNFSNNPSYTTGSYGEIAQQTFWGDPKSYITTVGLYDDKQQLLAVSKLSQPLLKSKKREVNIRVKLDY